MLRRFKFDRFKLHIPREEARFYRSTPSLATKNSDNHDLTIQPKINYGYLDQNAKAVSENMRRRNYNKVNMNEFQENYEERRKLYSELLLLRANHNELSKAIKLSINSSGDERQRLISQSKNLKAQVRFQEERLQKVESALSSQALQIPNDSHPEAPVGPESQARLVKIVGTPRKDTADKILEDHISIARRLNILDLDQAALVSGSSFYYLQGMGAFLETALIQYAMHKAAEHGFLGVITPDIVRTSVAYGCGFQPRSGESSQIYNVSTAGSDENSTHLCLAGTAEIPLAGKFAAKIIDESDLPQRLVGYGRAFRVEAGGRGTETKGLYRVHQFSKVELFAVTTSDNSDAMLEEFKQLQEDIFTELGLCFRILDMPTEELGASAYRKYDMEAWMPGRKKWGEISSTSNCTDYQSRRLSIRYRPTHHTGQNTYFCHTINGTAIAVPRIIIAILETFQNSDGTVSVPQVLQKWLPGQPSVLF